MEQRFSPFAHRVCLWTGVFMSVLYLIAFIFLAHFWPVPSPAWSAGQLAAWLGVHRVSFQIACVPMVICGGLLAPWGASLAVWSRKSEGRFPVLYLTQVVSLAVGTTIFVLIAIAWSIASLRANEISPEITQTMFDIGWFMFLFDIPPFMIWVGSLALAILWTPPEHQMYPRWSAYFTLAVAMCWSAALLVLFFDSGPFSYSGFLAMWYPLGMFFVWLVVMTILGFRAVSKQVEIDRDATSGGLGVWNAWDDGVSDAATSSPEWIDAEVSRAPPEENAPEAVSGGRWL